MKYEKEKLRKWSDPNFLFFIIQTDLPLTGHSTHIAMSTYQDNAWGDFMIHAIQHAIETALENDVRIRGGLPINYRSFLGTALNMDAYVAEAEKEVLENNGWGA